MRARAALRDAPPTLRGRHIAVGESGGLGSVTGALRRRLTWGGIRVTELHHPDDAVQAKEANELGVDVFVGLRLNPSTSGCSTAFWSGRHDESLGGRRLAELVQARARGPGVTDAGVHGMSVPLLRETRMPAVLVEVGPASTVVEGTPALAAALVDRARPLGRRLLGLITGNHNPRGPCRCRFGIPAPWRRLRDQCFRQVNQVTIHNVMHRLWMKLYPPLTVV